MQFNKFPRIDREEAVAGVVALDGIFSFLGVTLYPFAVGGMIATGLILKYFGDSDPWQFYPAVWGLHVLSGLGVTIMLGYRLVRGLGGRWWRNLRRGPVGWSGPGWAPLLLEALYRVSIVVLVFSGFALFAATWFGVSQPVFRPAFGWGVLHGIAGVYFLGFLLLRSFMWGKTTLQILRRYLYRP